MRPAETYRLIPQLYRYVEGPFRIACRHLVAHQASLAGEVRIVGRVPVTAMSFSAVRLLKPVGSRRLSLRYPTACSRPVVTRALGILEDRLVDLHLLGTGDLAVVGLEAERIGIVVVAHNRSIGVERPDSEHHLPICVSHDSMQPCSA